MELTGKKILIIKNDKSIGIGFIAGCNEDIGICIMNEQNTKAIFIAHGPLSPQIIKLKLIYDERDKRIFNHIKNQIISGYFSENLFDKYLEEQFGYFPDCTGDSQCPYSI